MKCDRCKKDFVEKEMEESHDVPRYLFDGFPNDRKNKADKFGRHWLCKKCHKEYEEELKSFLRIKAKEFSEQYFKEDEKW